MRCNFCQEIQSGKNVDKTRVVVICVAVRAVALVAAVLVVVVIKVDNSKPKRRKVIRKLVIRKKVCGMELLESYWQYLGAVVGLESSKPV